MAKKSESENQYTISELAKEFDVTSRALRLYEEGGLLSPIREGTKRIYLERDRVRIRLILRGKRLGWSLSEIREMFDIYDTESGEKAQLKVFIERLGERQRTLELQKKDVELALKDLMRIKKNAQQALNNILK